VISINFGAGFLDAEDAEVLWWRIGAMAATELVFIGRVFDDFNAADYVREFGQMLFVSVTLEDAVVHIDHAVKVGGIDHVGIGSD
jgi:microsomal dipeptidase-like Zn-dependent dipeptidase